MCGIVGAVSTRDIVPILVQGLARLEYRGYDSCGVAVYANGLIFALLDDGVVWLKADEANAPALQAAGARQFTYPTKDGKDMTMAYWSLPESALDDPDEAVDWARQSIDVALRKAAAKKVRKPRPQLKP